MKYCTFFLLLCSFYMTSQVGIRTTNPEATLDIRAEDHLGSVTATDGVLVPRVTDLSVNGATNGQLVFLNTPWTDDNGTVADTTDDTSYTLGFHFWNTTNSAWEPLNSTIEPWNRAGTADPASLNSDNLYTQGQVGIGTDNPLGALHITTQNSRDVLFFRFIDPLVDDLDLDLFRARGTATAPTLLQDNTRIGGLRGQAFTGSGAIFDPSAEIWFQSEGASSSTSSAGEINFATTPVGALSTQQRMTIKSNGRVGIGVAEPDNSSILDLSANNKGFLAPRVALDDVANTSIDGVNTNANGLMIYNTNVGVTNGSGVGYYYWNGTIWVSMTNPGIDNNKWSKDGDALTAGQFLGTTNAQALNFRVNNLSVGSIQTNNSLFFGHNASSGGASSLALGREANSTGGFSTSIGYLSNANGSNSIAFGSSANTTALGVGSLAMGQNASVDSASGIAIGSFSITEGDNAVAIGRASDAINSNSIAIGNSSNGRGDAAISIGLNSQATATGAIAIGEQSGASGFYATASGREANASANYTTSVGAGSDATAQNSSAFGYLAQATGTNSTAIGMAANVSGFRGTSLGYLATTPGLYGISIGAESDATQNSSIAIGNTAQSTAASGIALGSFSNAAGNFGISIGIQSDALAENAVALGNNTYADAVDAVAIGRQAEATALNTVALGTLAVANQPNTVILGSNNTGTRVGVGTSAPAATLDITGQPTDVTVLDGIVPPRITGDQLQAKTYTAAQNGAIVYVTAPPATSAGQTVNVNDEGVYAFQANSNTWEPLGSKIGQRQSVYREASLTNGQSLDPTGLIELDGLVRITVQRDSWQVYRPQIINISGSSIVVNVSGTTEGATNQVAHRPNFTLAPGGEVTGDPDNITYWRSDLRETNTTSLVLPNGHWYEIKWLAYDPVTPSSSSNPLRRIYMTAERLF